ncbi:MAG: hypothetical protein AAB865_00120 [Patescibacteria group bacterium]
MLFILILGIILVAAPVLGFAICGCVFLYNCIMEDSPVGLFGGILMSIVLGMILIAIYFGVHFAQA